MTGRESLQFRVLVVDDEPMMCALIADALGPTVEVVTAQDAPTALSLLEAPRHWIDLVIVDCLLSRAEPRRFDGITLLRTITRRWPWIPAIAITGALEADQLMAEALSSGARELLRKPFELSQLHESVERALRLENARLRGPSRTIIVVKRILAFLGEHVAEIPTLGELAAMATMSPSRFSRVFHAAVGMRLRDYMRELRLKRARELLADRSLSLTAIAMECGFYDLPHFDKVFRRRFGVSPQEFRNRLRVSGAGGGRAGPQPESRCG